MITAATAAATEISEKHTSNVNVEVDTMCVYSVRCVYKENERERPIAPMQTIGRTAIIEKNNPIARSLKICWLE